jgi:hypothetical protein
MLSFVNERLAGSIVNYCVALEWWSLENGLDVNRRGKRLQNPLFSGRIEVFRFRDTYEVWLCNGLVMCLRFL